MEAGAALVQKQPPEDDKAIEQLVEKFWKEYNAARAFDEDFRKQVAIDRRYAAGTSDTRWAVSTNLIGAFIDILTALLYARNPDVSVSKAPQVDDTDTAQMDAFAKTLEIVISQLWRKGNLKKAARKGVRSVLSNAEGWLKCMLVSEKTPQPEVERALNDARDTAARLEAQEKLLTDPDAQGGDPSTRAAELAEKQALIETLQSKIELAVTKMFVIDFVTTENIQVSTDISSISDYLDADWIGNEMFVTKEDALARFPDLKPEDIKSAKLYYQRSPKVTQQQTGAAISAPEQLSAEHAQMFTSSGPGEDKGPAFLRVVEKWDRRDKHIRTAIEGVKKWARAPYTPPYPTSRFYPYFFFSFYEVDGQRHPQSLSWRMMKLQDEYSSVRSNFRVTRERSIPGTIFNATGLDADEAKKLAESKNQEYTGLRPSDPSVPIGNLFASKPVASIDMRLYDPTYVLNDMERICGVQEALSSAINGPGNPRTATEAQIQQSGTNARTNADRDNLEGMLTDLANYTAEQALQCLTVKDAQRMAGTKAFWPGPSDDGSPGMDIEDLFTLVEVKIEAGTTGKPRQQTDQQAWATILPMIQQMLGQIEQALATGNKPMADSLTELVRETMVRLGDESDVARFIPRVPPPGSPGAGAPPPPVLPNVSVSLKGELSPEAAAMLVSPAVARDQASMPPPAPPQPPPGGGPAAAGSPPPPNPGAGPPGPPPGV